MFRLACEIVRWILSPWFYVLRVFGVTFPWMSGNIDAFDNNYKVSTEKSLSKKFDNAKHTDNFYDLVTDFYEYGWGQSFHFATQFVGESFMESIRRHEFKLASLLSLEKEDEVLDIGCGIGGPARNIARFSGSKITAITINQNQVDRGKALTWPETDVNFVKADFTKLPFGPNTFDKCFAIESTTHMFDREKPYSEAFRVLKPGGLFVLYEWCLNSKFDNKNKEHRQIRRGIEHGNGLPDLATVEECEEAARKVGFVVLESYCAAEEAKKMYGDKNVPWYSTLDFNWSISDFRKCTIGRMCTTGLLSALEFLGVAPAGSVKTANMLEDGAVNLVKAGKLGFFTPMHVLLVKKPAKTDWTSSASGMEL